MNAWDEIVIRDGRFCKIRDAAGRVVGVVAGLDGQVRYLTDRVEPAPPVDPGLLARLRETTRSLNDAAGRRTPPPAAPAQLELQEVEPAPAPAKVRPFRTRVLTAGDLEEIFAAVVRATQRGNAVTAVDMEGPFIGLDYRRRNQALNLLTRKGRIHLCFTKGQGPAHYYRSGPASSCSAQSHDRTIGAPR